MYFLYESLSLIFALQCPFITFPVEYWCEAAKLQTMPPNRLIGKLTIVLLKHKATLGSSGREEQCTGRGTEEAMFKKVYK